MLDKLRYRLAIFMNGRYGLDDLGRFLFIIGLVFDVIGMFTKNPIANAIAFVSIVFLMFRFLSKDIYHRQRENAAYRSLTQLVTTKFQLRKDYVVFKCKKCNRNIRVPRHHGKVEVTCPLCGEVKMVETGTKRNDF